MQSTDDLADIARSPRRVGRHRPIQPQRSWSTCSARLIEVKSSALVSDVAHRGDPAKLPYRESRLLRTRTWEVDRLSVDGGSADRGAVREMEVVWPSGGALRGEPSNHRALRPLTADVVGRAQETRRVSASRGGGGETQAEPALGRA